MAAVETIQGAQETKGNTSGTPTSTKNSKLAFSNPCRQSQMYTLFSYIDA